MAVNLNNRGKIEEKKNWDRYDGSFRTKLNRQKEILNLNACEEEIFR